MKSFIKNILPRTLFGRSLLILITPVLLIQIITTFVFFDNHWDKITRRLAYAVAGEIAIISDQIEKDASEENIKTIAGYVAGNLNLLMSFKNEATLPNINDNEINSVVAKTLAAELKSKVRRPYLINVDIQEKWIEVIIQLENGVLLVSLPQRRLFSSSGYIFILWVISSSIILLAIAILFMRNQIRPIRRLAVAAERIGKGRDIPSSFKPEGAYEIRQASRAFLDMHHRIRRQIQQRTAMLAGVSHDLRTPLTRMKLQAEILGNSSDIDALKSDINDMEHMIEAYLDFAKGEGSEKPESSNIASMMGSIISQAKRQGANIHLSCDESINIQLRPLAFKRCISNLISNARKYANTIWVDVSKMEKSIQVIVEDDGPGIKKELYDEVFKPFVRGEPSRNKTTGGVGLGLPIAQDIVHAHGGQIWLERSNKGGLKVVIQLPL
jgi:two-component system osmolarity sensor histidine kinase EnvZ